MKIVSGKTGEPHVTSQQFRQFIEGTAGQESYILTSGENMEPELSTNNLLKIRSGMMVHHGNISCAGGTYDEVTIQNGTQGMKRIDLVVNRYTREEASGIEKNEWVILQGTPHETSPTIPAYTEGNLQEGDLVDDCPVFEVHLNGINVTEIKKRLTILPTIPELNGNFDIRNTTKADVHFDGAWEIRHCEVRKMHKIVTLHARIYCGTIVENYEYTISQAIDADIRPATEVNLCAVAGDIYMQNIVACMCMIDSNGKIHLKVAGANKQYIDISGTYMV